MRLEWNQALYEAGLDRGVLYLGPTAVPWNGLVGVEEKAHGSIDTTLYFDTKRRRISQESGVFEAAVEAFTYPKEFNPYDGHDGEASGQPRARFGMSYRTQEADGYRIHLVYNATVAPSVAKRKTIEAVTSASTFNWDIHTTPMDIPGAKPGSHLMIRTHDARYPDAVVALEDILYGTETTPARLPSPTEVINLFESYVIFRITYHGDGTWMAEGPDEMVYETENGEFVLDAPSVFPMDEGSYQASSY